MMLLVFFLGFTCGAISIILGVLLLAKVNEDKPSLSELPWDWVRAIEVLKKRGYGEDEAVAMVRGMAADGGLCQFERYRPEDRH